MDIDIDFQKNWKKLLAYGVLGALFAGLLITKVGTRKGKAEGEFVKATHAFTKWEQVLDGEELLSLERIVKKHPELEARYDPLIGQSLLTKSSFEEAEPFITRTLKRTNQPYYSEYARASLLISDQKYGEALEMAHALKEKMISDNSFWEKGKESSALFAFNLMRIATLCQRLDDKKGELTAWQEIKRHGGWQEGVKRDERIGHEGFAQLLSHFTAEEISLLDYIQVREKDLSKK